MIKPSEQPSVKKICCHKMAGISAAQMKKMKEEHSRKGCEKQNCNMMFSCTLCGFIVIDILRLQPHHTNYAEKPISLYRIGNLSAYHPSDWKPPKAR